MSEATKLLKCLAAVASAAESETDFAELMIVVGKAVTECLDCDWCIAVAFTHEQVQSFRIGSQTPATQGSSFSGVDQIELHSWISNLNSDVSIVSAENVDYLYSTLDLSATDSEESLLVIRIPGFSGTGGLLVVSRKQMFKDREIKVASTVKAIVSTACARIGSDAQWQHKQMFSSLAEDASDMILWTSIDGDIMHASRSAVDVAGFQITELVSTSLADLVADEDRDEIRHFLDSLSDTSVPRSVDLRIMKPDGSKWWAEIHARSSETRNGLLVIHIIRDISYKKRQEAEVDRHARRLSALAARIEDVRESERTRLSREVHDQLGQSLTGIKMDISFLERRLDGANTGIQDILDQMKKSVDDLINSVRQIASDLRPSILDDLGIAAAIEWETKRFAERLEISHEFVSEIRPDDLVDQAKATTLFRVYQELLANIARHASAESISVYLNRKERSIDLTVTDDGVGFDVSVMNDGESLGLLGIQERVALHGGSVEVYSESGCGTKTVITIPMTEQLQ